VAVSGAVDAFAEAEPREKFLTLCAWGVHAYTALGAVLGLLSIEYAARLDFRASFAAMALAIAIDSSDGVLARAVKIRQRLPRFDGVLLDNVVDYLTYVVAPVFLMLRAGILVGSGGLLLGSFVMLASAYGFCQVDAKTEDHYFLGFPSYWNVLAFYLFCLRLATLANTVIVAAFAAMVFVPIKYIYPSRTVPLRAITITYGIIWGIATIAMIPMLPVVNRTLLYISLSYIVYYFAVSFALHARDTRARSGKLVASC
jgi:phosphatidylcholine synthase